MQASKLKVGKEYGISRHAVPERGLLVEVAARDPFARRSSDTYCVFKMLNVQTGIGIPSREREQVRARDVIGLWAEVAEQAKQRDTREQELRMQRQTNLERMYRVLELMGFQREEIGEYRHHLASVYVTSNEEQCHVTIRLKMLEHVQERRAEQMVEALRKASDAAFEPSPEL